MRELGTHYYLGVDLGSTTAKYVLLDNEGKVLCRSYERHQSAVVEVLIKELSKLSEYYDVPLKVNFTGSAALNLADSINVPFIQEVIAASTYLKSGEEPVDVAIELGGEDGKIIFLSNGIELRMNEACAGGTGAFIDQMATLLNVSTPELNELASHAQKTYPIASRCGVFAKTDLVALLNQGIDKADIAKSVFDAVCEQTISGLACGRVISGNVTFLGGPLSFLSELKQSFITKLESPNTHFLNFDDTQYAIAYGAARAALKDDLQKQSLTSTPCLDAHHPARSRSNSSSESTAIREPIMLDASSLANAANAASTQNPLGRGNNEQDVATTAAPSVTSSVNSSVTSTASTSLNASDEDGTTSIARIIAALHKCETTFTSARLSPLFTTTGTTSSVSPSEKDAPSLATTAATDAASASAAATATSSATTSTATEQVKKAQGQAQAQVQAQDQTQTQQENTATALSPDQAPVVTYHEDGKRGADATYGVLESYEDFVKRHAQHTVATRDLSLAQGPLYLGIDLGSTTIKLVLIDEANTMYASYYAHNGGEPLKNLMPKVQELVTNLPRGAYIAAICTTGYGADLAKSALNAQFSEVETLAHQKAAVAFDPEVSYVIDIGGQDMKCIKVDHGVIASIQLNEACSSGCGSFLETFAAQLQLPLKDFVKEALEAKAPCDLGTRCTVFMNSKVKQAQRDNVPIGDIAAGLCLSIVRNALYKVLRIHDSEELGDHVVVQGGTFLNDAILRAFEINIHKDVIRPNIAGLMGAFGAALIAKERCTTKDQAHAMSFPEEIFDLSQIKVRNFRCRGCNNHCQLTMNTFLSGQKHIHGNRCDFALHSSDKQKADGENFYNRKLELLFDRPILFSRAQHAEAEAQAEVQAALEQKQKEKAIAAAKAAAAARKAKNAEAATVAASAAAASATAAKPEPTSQEARAAKALAAARAAKAAKAAQAAKAAKAAKEAQAAQAAQMTQVANAAAPELQLAPTATKKAASLVVPPEVAVATRGSIGIPRVLNMFEHYPFWHALFTKLRFNIVLSPVSTKEIMQLGNSSIPSQSLCLPAKLAHGHLTYLAEHGIERIFMPCVPREKKYFTENDDSFACPVVGGYPEALKLNLRALYPKLKLYTPYLLLDVDKSIIKAVQEIDPSIKSKEIKEAILSAREAMAQYHYDLSKMAVEQIEKAHKEHLPLIVLSGHPYHIDPLLNHGIPALIASMGTIIVSEDAIAQLTNHGPELDVVNQWAFHSRLYRAAQYVIEHEHTEMVQLVSFGCGIDAITSEQVKKILERNHRLYTMLKIDEGDTLGAAKIRLRSLLCATADAERSHEVLKQVIETTDTNAVSQQAINFTATENQSCGCGGSLGNSCGCAIEGKLDPNAAKNSARTSTDSLAMSLSEAITNDTLKERTLYMPQMAPVHFPILATCLESLGYKVKLLKKVSPEAIELGLKHVNNDACYPAIVAIGQLLEPVSKGEVDPKTSALLLAQTCGPCRATNYPALLNWALHDLHAEHIPVVTLQGSDLEDEKLHLKLGFKGLRRLMLSLLYGDLLQSLYLHCHTYEKVPGTAQKLLEQFHQELTAEVLSKPKQFKRRVKEMVAEFSQIPLRDELRPKVGIVGEILLKYHPDANNELVENVIAEGGEPVLGDISAFVLYCLHDSIYQAQNLGTSKLTAMVSWLLLKQFEAKRTIIINALKNSKFEPLPCFSDLMDYGRKFVSLGQQAGEGWLLTAEMVDFIEHGIENIICVQPFACLPNHITGKGVMRAIRETYDYANLCSIDYEAGSAQSNVLNRIKLFITQAKDNLIAKQQQEAAAAAAATAGLAEKEQVIPNLAAASVAAVSHSTATTKPYDFQVYYIRDKALNDIKERAIETADNRNHLRAHHHADNDELEYGSNSATERNSTITSTGTDNESSQLQNK